MESGDGQTHRNQSHRDQSYYDLGGRGLDCGLVDALSLRGERSDHLALSHRCSRDQQTKTPSAKNGRADQVIQTEFIERLGRVFEHDPEKWTPIFGKDHAQTTS
jgi:hypothetical protein